MGEKNETMKVVHTKPEPKITKAEQKILDRKAKAQADLQAEAQLKQMEQQIGAMHKSVQSSMCKTCVNCANRDMKKDRFKVKSSKGNEVYVPMNFCTIAGLSLVDVQECEIYEKYVAK